MNRISDLPQFLSITAAQLLHDCGMSICRSAVPLRKGGLLLQEGQLTARLLRRNDGRPNFVTTNVVT
jgi:hypothetical protein